MRDLVLEHRVGGHPPACWIARVFAPACLLHLLTLVHRLWIDIGRADRLAALFSVSTNGLVQLGNFPSCLRLSANRLNGFVLNPQPLGHLPVTALKFEKTAARTASAYTTWLWGICGE